MRLQTLEANQLRLPCEFLCAAVFLKIRPFLSNARHILLIFALLGNHKL